MPEGPDIQGVLDDYSRQHQPADETGFTELVTVMTSAKQVKDAAMVAGFREDEALQFSRDYLTSMYEASHRTASG